MKKKQKKFFHRGLSLLLSLLMCASLAMPAYAADVDVQTDGTTVTAVEPDAASDAAQPVVVDEGNASQPADEAPAENAAEADAAPADASSADASADSSADASEDAPADEPTDAAEPAADPQPADQDAAASTVIASFGDYEVMQTLERGTLDEIKAQLPTQLDVTLTDGTTATISVTWQSQDEDGYTAAPENYNALVFQAVLPEGWTLDAANADLELPTITIQLADPFDIMPMAEGEVCYFGTDERSGESLITGTGYQGKNLNLGTTHEKDDGSLAYCFAQGRANPEFSITDYPYMFIGYANSDAAAILDAGYPNTTTIGGVELTANQARQATQAALWVVSPYNRTTISLSSMKVTTLGKTNGGQDVLDAVDYLVNVAAAKGSNSLYAVYKPSEDGVIDWSGAETGYQTMLLAVNERPANGKISVQKASADPTMTVSNSCYSLNGAQYGIYDSSSCSTDSLVETVTTNSNGYAESESLAAGDYWVKEISPSTGYLLDSTVYSATVESDETTTVNVSEQPANDPVGLTLTKISDGNTTNMPSLAGAQFTVKYYAGQYNSVSQLPSQATRTWVLQTRQVGNRYLAALDDVYKVAGDSFYRTASGKATLPLGTITIQETSAPTGYTLSGSYINDSTGALVSDSNGIVLLQETQNGLGSNGYLRGGNAYTKKDVEIHGGIQIYKQDADTGLTQPSGDASLAGMTVDIISRNALPIEVDGKTYNKGDVVTTLTTDANGYAATGSKYLPYGTYEVKETKAPTGYVLPENNSQTVTITEDNKFVTVNLKDSVMRGGVEIYKLDADTGLNQPNGGASLEGMTVDIISRNANSIVVDGKTYNPGDVVTTLTTDDTGHAATTDQYLPYGTYELVETNAPTGYLLPENNSQTVKITADKQVITVNFEDFVMRGGLQVYKQDADTGLNQPYGGASLEGMTVDVINRNPMPVTVDGKNYKPGEVITTLTTDANGHVATGNKYLPYGTYELVETKAPTGYVLPDNNSQIVQITQDSKFVALTFKDSVIRGDFEMRKIDIDSQQSMANVLFEITSDATGETHQFMTDENGFFSTESTYVPHSTNTNAGTVGAGLWFGEYVAADGSTKQIPVDDARGALPYGTYTITELPCDANKDYIMWSGKITISRNGFTVDLKDVENFQMRLSTTAKDEATNSHYASSVGETTIIDTVRYENLLKNTQYTMVGVLMNKATQQPVRDADGNLVSASKTFTTKTRNGQVEMELTFDASALAGSDVVVFEYLYLGDKGDTSGNGAAVSHADINDEDQTVYLPAIGTTAQDKDTGDHIANAGKITIVDTVSYTNLQPGKTYTVTGVLMNKTTGEAALDANGKQITASASFKAAESNGTVDITFTFDSSNLAGETLVAFETLQYRGNDWAVHADINDEAQSIHIPAVRTTATADATGDHIVNAAEGVTLTDRVALTNLVVGKEYTLTAELIGSPSGDTLATVDQTFTATAADMTVPVSVKLDASKLAGTDVVFFETLTFNGVQVGKHRDLDDADQTIHIPEIYTTAIDKESGTHNAMADKDVTIVDSVYYNNLIAGKEYTVTGTLMDKATGKALQDAQGNTVTASTTFTAEESKGTVDITFTFDGSLLAGKTVVAFESLLYKGVEVGVHADINDEDQSIHFPHLSTTAVEKENGEHITKAEKKVTLVDTVAYKNLLPGQKYVMNATVMLKSTGEALLDAKGNPVTASTEFTAKTADGTVDLTVTIDASALAADSVVFFESLTTNNAEVGLHADIDDEDQTVHFPLIQTTAISGDTKDHIGLATKDATLTDTVSYKNLIPGVEYTMTGTLMVKSTGKALQDADGNAVTASATFTPDSANGTVDLTFHFDASGLAGESLVAFESLTYKGVEIADHNDINDEGQTVHYPDVHTTAEDVESGTHNANADAEVTVKDTVQYTNLIAGKEYTVTGTLMVKSTGEALLDAEGNPVTASATFTAEQSDGSIDLTFKFDGSLLAGDSVVAFERISYNGIDVGIHEDLTDEDQTIHFVKVSTTATEKENGEHVTKATDKVTLTDAVALENLIPGQEYTLKATLVSANGEKVLGTSEKTFTATEVNMTVDLEVTLDVSTLAGQSVVFFEHLYTNGAEIGSHADLEDEGQTVHFPEVKTNAIDKESGTHSSIADEDVTIVDTVTYTNLIPGQEYTVSGVLMNKATGEKLLDAQGNVVTSTVTFTPDEANGSIDLTFHFDGSLLAGQTVVVFESLAYRGVEVGVHADLNDENQTVSFPGIQTTAIDSNTKSHKATVSNAATIVDTVQYANLTPGQLYTLVGTLMDKATGEALLDAAGNAVTASMTFTPETASGSVEMSFTFDASALGGHTVVVFERVYQGTDTTAQPIAIHEDINSADQSVELVTPPAAPKTGDTAMPALAGMLLLMAAGCVVLVRSKRHTH